MRAGFLDRLIQIGQYTEEVDEVGQPIKTWESFAENVPAKVDYRGGREYYVASGLASVESACFKVRWLSGLVTGMRVQYDNKIWDISFVEPGYGRHREMHVYATTGLTEG